eukprot:TRINITY_DN6390_c0_g1_i1.p1 TRINITY_DN6390_c0_g1~~TRINITY_DN6390_c0_g1_i1.p1  ORF type:complete len:284 (-),score=37.38 TRINITY_DN6390_c0_g1_i1:201-1052(-)
MLQLIFLTLLLIPSVTTQLKNCSSWSAIYPEVGIRCEDGWLDYANLLNAEIKQQYKIDVIFYGDSITEQLRGTRNGFVDCVWCHPKLVEEFQNFSKSKGWHTFVSGISGDQTAQLLWRLKNGQLERDLKTVKLAILNIGTNDLHSTAKNKTVVQHELVDFIVQRITSIEQLLNQSLVNSRIVVLGLLPRGNGSVYQFFDPSTLQPEDYRIPNVYSPYIKKINNKLRNYYSDNFLDCGSNFVTKDGNLDKDMMLDTVHPTTAGWTSLLNCIGEFLQKTQVNEEL